MTLRKVQAEQLDLSSPNSEEFTTGGADDLAAGDKLVISDVSDSDKGKVATMQQVADFVSENLSGPVEYKGAWDASSNTPTLVDPPTADTSGHYYIVSAPGTQFSVSWAIGDWIVSNGVSWEKIDNSDTVSSVNGSTGAVTLDYSDVGAAPSSHVGSGGSEHADATVSTSGFMSATDKGLLDEMHEFHEAISDTGIISGGTVTPTGGINFTISAGVAHISNHVTESVTVPFGPISDSTIYAGGNWLYIDSNGDLQIFSSETDSKDYAYVGFIETDGTNTSVIDYSDIKIYLLPDITRRLIKFLRYGIGPRVKSGIAVSEQANPDYLKLSISSGSWFLHLQEIAQSATTSFIKSYQSTDGIQIDTNNLNTVEPGYWNDITQPTVSALVAMTASYWKKDLIFTTPEGNIYYAYGQAEYATEDAAKEAPLPSIPEDISTSICYLATIVSQQGDTSIATRLYDVRPMTSRLFGIGGYSAPSTGVSHSDLTNLSSDDHTQYHNDTRGDARYYTKSQSNSNYTPLSHVGSGGTSHADATTSVAGFMSTSDKTILDDIKGAEYLALSTNTSLTSERVLALTANQLSGSDAGAGNAYTLSIADNPILPGTESVTVPTGTTVQEPASPQNGMVRFDTDLKRLRLYENNQWKALSGVIYKNSTSSTLTGDTNENAILSYSIPANAMEADTIIKATVGGIITSNQNGTTWTLRVRYGATILYEDTSSSLSNGTTSGFLVSLAFTSDNSTSSQKVTGEIEINGTGAATIGVGNWANTSSKSTTILARSSTETTTSAKTFQITLQSNTTNHSVTRYYSLLEKL